jgi:hypothetical protein
MMMWVKHMVPGAKKKERADQPGSKKMEIRDRIMVYLPIAAAGAIVGISAVYTIGMIWYQKILVWIFDGVILLTGFVISQKIKEL